MVRIGIDASAEGRKTCKIGDSARSKFPFTEYSHRDGWNLQKTGMKSSRTVLLVSENGHSSEGPELAHL